MTAADLFALTPFLILTATVVLQLGVASTSRSHALTAGTGIIGLIAAAVSPLWGPGVVHATPITSLITLDGLGCIALAICVLGATGASALAWQRAEALKSAGLQADPVELHLLITITAIGGALAAVASHVLTFVLGIEIAAIAYAAAIAWRRDDGASIEGAVKTLIMGAVGTSFILFGAALAWFHTDALSLAQIGHAPLTPNLIILVGVAIKLGAIPFHGWVIDAWHAATSPIALLLGITAKVGIVAAIIHIWPFGGAATGHVLLVLAIASMCGGALLGTQQTRIRRLLAASSIAHMGDILLGVSLGGETAHEAVVLYLACYALSLLAVFAAVEALADHEERDTLLALAGSGQRHPMAAICFSLGIASLAGIPFTAGFAGKLALLLAAAQLGAWIPLLALAAGTVISGSFYLRMLIAIWQPTGAGAERTDRAPAALAVLVALALVIYGVVPSILSAPIGLFVG